MYVCMDVYVSAICLGYMCICMYVWMHLCAEHVTDMHVCHVCMYGATVFSFVKKTVTFLISKKRCAGEGIRAAASAKQSDSDNPKP